MREVLIENDIDRSIKGHKQSIIKLFLSDK
jgi:hypothetical protein